VAVQRDRPVDLLQDLGGAALREGVEGQGRLVEADVVAGDGDREQPVPSGW
jgi:hypothetical protein